MYVPDFARENGRYTLKTVLGVGKPRIKVNGLVREGIPYFDLFEGQDNALNPNSYLRGDTVRVKQ